MTSWKTACGEDALALGLQRANGSWDNFVVQAHIRRCPQCEDFSYRARMLPFPDLLGLLHPLVPHSDRTHIKLVCVDCKGSYTWLEPRETATPDSLLEIAEAHRREAHAGPDPGA